MAQIDAVFKAYDIRGTVPDQLDEELCRAVGAAFARWAQQPQILVGRDMRESSVAFANQLAEGAQSQGVDVVDLGLCSTDLVFYASGRLDSPAAMITASHNPAGYNGIKLCLAGAKPVGEESGLRDIKELALGAMTVADRPGRMTHRDMLEEYVAHVHSMIDVSSLRPLKVVADTANGMGGLVVPVAFAGLPIELELMYGELDGTFPNHPADPIQTENQQDLIKRVLETGADVGLAFDGDADRVFLVDDQGEPMSGSTTTALVAKGMLAKNPGAKVLHNLICSKAVAEVIREEGGEPIRTRVGHSFIKGVMAETGAVFGGEHSGHYYFRDNYRADSGLIASMIILEQLSAVGQPLSELRRPLERYAASGEINTRVDDPLATIEQVAAAHAGASQDRLDGLTVDHGDWWFNLRPSNTEPLLRLNLEAPTQEECDRHVDEVLALVRGE